CRFQCHTNRCTGAAEAKGPRLIRERPWARQCKRGPSANSRVAYCVALSFSVFSDHDRPSNDSDCRLRAPGVMYRWRCHPATRPALLSSMSAPADRDPNPAIEPPARPGRNEATLAAIRKVGPLAIVAIIAVTAIGLGWHPALSLETVMRHRTAIDGFIA